VQIATISQITPKMAILREIGEKMEKAKITGHELSEIIRRTKFAGSHSNRDADMMKHLKMPVKSVGKKRSNKTLPARDK